MFVALILSLKVCVKLIRPSEVKMALDYPFLNLSDMLTSTASCTGE